MISRSITSEDLIAFNLYLLNHFTLCLSLDTQLASQLEQVHQQSSLQFKYALPPLGEKTSLTFYNFQSQTPISYSRNYAQNLQHDFTISKAEKLLVSLGKQEWKYINNELLDAQAFATNHVNNSLYLYFQPQQPREPQLQYLVYQLASQRIAQQKILDKLVQWDFKQLLSYYGKQLNFLENLQQHPRFQRLVDHCAREDANMWNRGLAKLKQALPLLLEQELCKYFAQQNLKVAYTYTGEIVYNQMLWVQMNPQALRAVFQATLKSLSSFNFFDNACVTYISHDFEVQNKNLLPEFQELPYKLSQPEQLYAAYSTESSFQGVHNSLTVELLRDIDQDIKEWLAAVNTALINNEQRESSQFTFDNCLGILLKNIEFIINSNQNVYGVPLVSRRVLHLVTLRQHIEFNEQLDYENYLGNAQVTTFARDHFNKYLSHREPSGTHLHGLYHLMRNKHKSKVVPKVTKSNITLTPEYQARSLLAQVELTIPQHLKTWQASSNKTRTAHARLGLSSNYPLLQTRAEQEFAQQLAQEYANKVYLEETIHQLKSHNELQQIAEPAPCFDQLQAQESNLPMRCYLQAAVNLLHNSVKKSLFKGVNVFEASTAFLSLGWLYEAILHHLEQLRADNTVAWDADLAFTEVVDNLLSLRGNSALLFLEPNKNYKHLLVHEFKTWLKHNDNLNHNNASDLQAIALHFDAGILKPQQHVFTYLTTHSGIIRGIRMELLGITIEWEVVNPHRILNKQSVNYQHPFASHTLQQDEYVAVRTQIKPSNYIEARIVLALLFGTQEVAHPTYGLTANYDMLLRGIEICDTVRITDLDILRKNVTSYLPNTDTDFTALWNSL